MVSARHCTCNSLGKALVFRIKLSSLLSSAFMISLHSLHLTSAMFSSWQVVDEPSEVQWHSALQLLELSRTFCLHSDKVSNDLSAVKKKYWEEYYYNLSTKMHVTYAWRYLHTESLSILSTLVYHSHSQPNILTFPFPFKVNMTWKIIPTLSRQPTHNVPPCSWYMEWFTPQ